MGTKWVWRSPNRFHDQETIWYKSIRWFFQGFWPFEVTNECGDQGCSHHQVLLSFRFSSLSAQRQAWPCRTSLHITFYVIILQCHEICPSFTRTEIPSARQGRWRFTLSFFSELPGGNRALMLRRERWDELLICDWPFFGPCRKLGSIGSGSTPANHSQSDHLPSTRQPIRVPMYTTWPS